MDLKKMWTEQQIKKQDISALMQKSSAECKYPQ